MQYSLKSISSIIILLFLGISIGFSQVNDRFWTKVKLGGNIGIGFSNDTFNATIAPAAVYPINSWVSTGLGVSFGYTDARNYTATTYGASLITLFTPIEGIALSAEFEETGVNRSIETTVGNIKESYWYPSLFLGAGYTIHNVSIGLRYDILYDSDTSIYANAYVPFVRVFF